MFYVYSLSKRGCEFQSRPGVCVAYTQCSPFLHLLDNLVKPVQTLIGGLVRKSYICGLINGGGDVIHPAVCCPDETSSLKMINTTSPHEEDTESQKEVEETQMASLHQEEMETVQQEEEMKVINLLKKKEEVETEQEEENDLECHPALQYLAHKDACGISLVDNVEARPLKGKFK